MTVSIANMGQVWMSNSNVYNAISMTVSTLGVGGHPNSSLLRFNVDANIAFKIDASGSIFTIGNVVASNTITTNTVVANIVTTVANTVANLSNAIIVGAGSRSFVKDANNNTFGSKVFTGGTNAVPVFSNGTYWLIG